MLSTRFINPPFLKGSGSRKLKAKYVEPFEIVRRVSATSYELDLPDSIKAHPVINLEYPKEFHESPERFASREVQHLSLSSALLKMSLNTRWTISRITDTPRQVSWNSSSPGLGIRLGRTPGNPLKT
jgi:hypothetical protein